MEALLRASLDPMWPAEPVLVISNKPDAAGLERARSFGVKAIAIDHKPFGKDRESFERALDAELKKANVDLVALAGFMRILTGWFVNEWKGRMVNIHPSLLPKYTGTNTHQACLDAGDTIHGCTVHEVIGGVDEGPAMGQAEIDVKPGDTPDTLAARVLKAEHILFPRCVAALARGGGRQVREEITVGGDTIRIFAPK